MHARRLGRLPGREQRQWLGDATVEFLVGQAGFGSTVNALNRQFLLYAAESQRPDGTEGVVRRASGTGLAEGALILAPEAHRLMMVP